MRGAIERDGYTIIADFMDAARLAEVRRVLGFYLGAHTGRNPFEGHSTERVYTLVARGRVFWDIVLDARVLALCDRFLLPGLPAHRQPGDLHPPGREAAGFPPRRHLLYRAAAAADDLDLDHRRGGCLHRRQRRHRDHSGQPPLGRRLARQRGRRAARSR